MATAFNTATRSRDEFLGNARCVICGDARKWALRHCLIIKSDECYPVSRKVYVSLPRYQVDRLCWSSSLRPRLQVMRPLAESLSGYSVIEDIT